MKIPEHAKRVFQGSIFDLYQWEQPMFDGSTVIFESIKRPGTILVIPTQDQKIFIADEEQPGKPQYLTLLGGRQEANEQPLESAKRELLEESGLTSTDWELYKVLESSGKFDWQIYLYLARNCQKTTEPALDPGEKITVKAVSFNQFIEIMCNGGGEVALEFLKMKVNRPAEISELEKKLFSKI